MDLTYTLLDSLNNVVTTGPLTNGVYQIVPSNLVQLDSVPNYTITYVNGTLTVGNPVVASATAGTITCTGDTTILTISATGGTAPYFGTGVQTVSAGPYSYIVLDSNGCSSEVSGTITEPDLLISNSTYSEILCFGGLTEVMVSASGGVLPYSGTGTFTVSAGPYSFTVTDANGCTSNTFGTISGPISNLSATVVEGTILCNGETTTVDITATGGSGFYIGTGIQTVSAGPYSFVVTDLNGCTVAVNGSINEPDLLYASSTFSDVLCFGETTEILVDAIGGTAPYNGTGVQTNVSAGTYTYIVTDANGCTSETMGLVNQPATPVSASKTEGIISCAGGSTTVTITASGGAGFYSGIGVQTVTAGPYSFIVSDINGCTIIVSGTISEPLPLIANKFVGTIACYGQTTTVDITASGGVGPYTGTGLHTVAAGPYSFVVTDANGCTVLKSVVLSHNLLLPSRHPLLEV